MLWYATCITASLARRLSDSATQLEVLSSDALMHLTGQVWDVMDCIYECPFIIIHALSHPHVIRKLFAPHTDEDK